MVLYWGEGAGANRRKLLKKCPEPLFCWRGSNSFLTQELLGNSSYHNNDDDDDDNDDDDDDDDDDDKFFSWGRA